jgi:hypothetical protein
VISFAAYLNKVGGMSYGKIASLLKELVGLEVARSALCRALARLARRAEPTYEALVQKVRASPIVYPDETGWREGGRSAWLWAHATPSATVYSIERGRGYTEAAKILGADYPGIIGADGWAPYRLFRHATLQTCLAHLLRRCDEMLETATRGGVRFPRKIKTILKDALELRDRRDARQISPHGLRVAKGRLEARMGRALCARITNAANRRFAKQLLEERDGDTLREGIRVLAQVLMESEVSGLIGAERYERSGRCRRWCRRRTSTACRRGRWPTAQPFPSTWWPGRSP